MNKLFAVAALVLTSGTAFAHTELEASTPADEAVLDAAPQEIVLTFSEAAKLTAVSIQRIGGEKEEIAPLPAQANERFALPTPALSAGDYVISWRALSDDMHVASGEIHFQLRSAAAAAR